MSHLTVNHRAVLLSPTPFFVILCPSPATTNCSPHVHAHTHAALSHTHTHTHTHTRAYIRTHTHICIHTHTHMHTRTHACIHTHTHPSNLGLSLRVKGVPRSLGTSSMPLSGRVVSTMSRSLSTFTVTVACRGREGGREQLILRYLHRERERGRKRNRQRALGGGGISYRRG